MPSKTRIEIPGEIAAQVQFNSDRTCCVCWVRGKPYQIHHIDEDPSNNDIDNLAVLCFDCHNETQLRGGFSRKLDAFQIVKYRTDWTKRVASKRDKEHGPSSLSRSEILTASVLRILKIEEKSNETGYSIDAEYPRFEPETSGSLAEVNLCIAAFVMRIIQPFRSQAIQRSNEKAELRKTSPSAAWDSLSISHRLSLVTDELLSMDFSAWTYNAGAAHPTRQTYTLTVQRNPPLEINPKDMFDKSSEYLHLLSEYCVGELRRQESDNGDKTIEKTKDDWILSGAGPNAKNYERLVLEGRGLRVFFDEYQVGCHAEGRSEVFVPVACFGQALTPSMKALLKLKEWHYQGSAVRTL